MMHPQLLRKIFNSFADLTEDASFMLNASKVVFTNGCFDLLHPGHIDCLMRSKDLGDILVVGLNHDQSVKRLKGADRPIQEWQDRATILAALTCVDLIIGFEDDTPLTLIQQLKPSVATKGGDYTADQMIGADFMKGYGGEMIILPFVEGYSTTAIIDRQV